MLGAQTFADVVLRITDSLRSVRAASKKGQAKGLEHCIQPVFDLEVSPEAYDSFFNSPSGYRARYLRDPFEGLTANHVLINALLNRLLDDAKLSIDQDLKRIDIRTSLRALSSKVWIYEGTFNFDAPTVDLSVGSWAEEAFNGERRAKWGLCAPEGTRLQVKGALLDPKGHEIVPRGKTLRHVDIHKYGFS